MTYGVGRLTYNSGLCELRSFAQEKGWPPCSQGESGHHIWNKGRWPRGRRRKDVKRIVEKKYPHIFYAKICPTHNRDKWADNEEACVYLLRERLRNYPQTEQAIRELMACYKIPPHELVRVLCQD